MTRQVHKEMGAEQKVEAFTWVTQDQTTKQELSSHLGPSQPTKEPRFLDQTPHILSRPGHNFLHEAAFLQPQETLHCMLSPTPTQHTNMEVLKAAARRLKHWGQLRSHPPHSPGEGVKGSQSNWENR